METPQQTLQRALLRLRSEGAEEHVDHDEVNELDQLKEKIKQLNARLLEKTELCNSLQGALTDLMDRGSTISKQPYKLSKEFVASLIDNYPRQVWFSIKVPRVVYAIYLKLATTVTEKIMRGERTSSLTFDECVELVDEEVRIQWEKKIPPAIETVLSLDVIVYKSNADASTKANGTPCQPGHFLVFIIRKLHNHITNFMHNWKQSQGQEKKFDNKYYVDLPTSPEVKPDKPAKWHNNPIGLDEFQRIHQASVTSSQSIATHADCVAAISVCAEKLESKPPLNDIIKYISSIVALQNHAAINDWKISGNQ